MIIHARKGQVNYGQTIGILLMETQVPFIPGDVGNADSFDFPVRYEVVPGLTTDRVLRGDMACLTALVESVEKLERDGIQAVTGDCGFMAYFQRHVMTHVRIPVFLSSLIQLAFLDLIVPPERKIGVITAVNGRGIGDQCD